MRLRACLVLVLLGLTGCTAFPARVRIELDDRSIEIIAKPEPAPPSDGR